MSLPAALTTDGHPTVVPERDIAELAARLRGVLLRPDTPGYDEAERCGTP